MTPTEFLTKYDALLAKHGSQRAVATAIGIARTTLQAWLARRDQIMFTKRSPQPARTVALPRNGVVKRFILTSAQNGTAIHSGFLANLEAYAEHLEAEIIIGGFTYDKRLFEAHDKADATQDWAEPVRQYLCNHRVNLGDNLLWCGEMNTLPTAVHPLSGFETYSGSKWGIFPHAKVQLRSIPTMKNTPAKIIMTTGAVTLPNYVQKRAGIKAHFHHILGAVLVELDADGDQFCRHLLAEEDTGAFQDLTTRVSEGVVTEGQRVEAITWGDIHCEQIDPSIERATWGTGSGDGMMDWLKPRYQFIHDVADFRARNHHNIKDPHHNFKMFVHGTDTISNDLENIAGFLQSIQRKWCQTIVVESNHDKAIVKWLKEADWKADVVNAETFLELQLATLKAIRKGDTRFSPLEWWLVAKNPLSTCSKIQFLREDDSFVVCGIEQGMHGHLGANGAKGHPNAFTKMGPKTNTGHTHSAGITDGAYVAGTKSKLDLGYNSGLSSWTHTDIVTYPNGKRALITMTPGGKWCAQ